jgi:outer membrane protein assembly factor BamD (BamD/ComL family)
MHDQLINEILTQQSPEIQDLKANATILLSFLAFIKRVDSLSGVDKRFYELQRSLYQATSSGRDMVSLEELFKEYFGLPIKPAGKSLPLKLRLNASVKRLNGLKKEQVLFVKKLKEGEFYGALWPWQRDPRRIEIHLGYGSGSISESDYGQLDILVKKYLSKATLDQVEAGVGGRIHGISLPSFLQMAEMEGSTFKLKISSGEKTGYLEVQKGSLIGAQTQGIMGREAAYRIISWENIAIDIEQAAPAQPDQIQQPLMHVLMESLKIKDEAALPAEAVETAPGHPPALGEISAGKADGIAAEAVAQTPAKATFRIAPFERAVPQRMAAPSRKNRIVLIAAGVAATLILLAAGTALTLKLLKTARIETEYRNMLARVEIEIEPEKKEKLIQQYIDTYGPGSHLAEITQKIDEVRQLYEVRDFEKTTLSVNSQPIDENYETKALEIYAQFLEKYPNSRFAKEIDRAIAGIKELLDTTYYNRATDAGKFDLGRRFEAYQSYLSRFPNGKHREEVEKLMLGMGDEYYGFIQAEAAVCEKEQTWDKCIHYCDNYIKVFETNPRVAAVLSIKNQLLDQQAFEALTREAAKNPDDYQQALDLFTQFQKSHPESWAKAGVEQKIKELTPKARNQMEWEKMQAFAKNPQNDVLERSERLQRYLEKSGDTPYARPARDLLEELQGEQKEARHRRDLAIAKRKEAQQAAQQAAAQEQMAARIRRLTDAFVDQIDQSGSRYQARRDGTVTDSATGLMWALLDSQQELGHCVNYDSAVNYVKQLQKGGYRDWRLPSSEELASLYKNPPFFPQSGAAWYWTAEVYARGYHSVANIVTSKPEKSFSRQHVDQSQCGSVRAVRP